MSDSATIQIGGETRALADADESWVTQQVNRRRREGQSVCVVVRIHTSGIDVNLATPACGGGGGGGRLPNTKEQDVIDLWRKHGLNTDDFSGGNLVAFLKQINRSL
jgi:hypothetical protein